MNNLTKPGSLPKNTTIPRFEVYCKNATGTTQAITSYSKEVGFNVKDEVPLPFPFATSLPLIAPIIEHHKYPIKAFASIVHIKQTIQQLRPIKMTESIVKKAIMEGGTNTDRGSELASTVELYSNKELVANGTSTFLIVKKRGAPAPQTPLGENPTKTYEFKVSAKQGLRYAAVSGDYNPWHLYPFTAKFFGFKTAIAHGFWAVAKCLAEIQDHLPKYPLSFEVEWKRPVFQPSSVVLQEYVSENGNKIQFQLWSADKQHLHLQGTIQHIPNMTIPPS